MTPGISRVAERRIRDDIIAGPYGRFLGMEVGEIAPDSATVHLPYRPELGNGAGVVHGGATASLVDAAATAAAWASPEIADTTKGATVGFTVNFLQPGRHTRPLTASAHVVRRGGSLTVVDVLVTDDEDRKIAKGQVTYKLGLGPSYAGRFDG